MHNQTVVQLVAILRNGEWSAPHTELLRVPHWNPTAVAETLEVLYLAGVIRRDTAEWESHTRYQWVS